MGEDGHVSNVALDEAFWKECAEKLPLDAPRVSVEATAAVEIWLISENEVPHE